MKDEQLELLPADAPECGTPEAQVFTEPCKVTALAIEPCAAIQFAAKHRLIEWLPMTVDRGVTIRGTPGLTRGKRWMNFDWCPFCGAAYRVKAPGMQPGDRVTVRPGMDVDRGELTLRHRRDDGQWVCDSAHGDVWTYGEHALRPAAQEPKG